MSEIKVLTEDNFDDVIADNDIIVIDFWAKWCQPCVSFSKVMSSVAKTYPEVVFASVNIEEQKALAEEFEIRSIPFVMILKNQVIIYAEAGALTANVLQDLVDQAVSTAAE